MTFSLCMIVKNEEKILERCLGSVCDLVDEIIIVDTGSTDETKTIAARYTDKIYDFEWIDDFAAARNYAFSKASMDYIYSADADEVIDEDNRERFRILKETLTSDVDIVQMKYGNQLSFGTVYNFDEEYRPKLFKRLREFIWEEPIHEQVRLYPVVFDSDIVITHLPLNNHSGRDLATFRKSIAKGNRLSQRLHGMYARELYMSGNADDFKAARPFFEESMQDTSRSAAELMEASLIVAHACRIAKDDPGFFKAIMKITCQEGCSEACMELGCYYEDRKDLEEAAIWYYNAAFETEPILKLVSGSTEPLEALIRVYEALGMPEQAEEYRVVLNNKK